MRTRRGDSKRESAPARLLCLGLVLLFAGFGCGGEDSGSRNGESPTGARIEAEDRKFGEMGQERRSAEKRDGDPPAALTGDERDARRAATDFYSILREERGGPDNPIIDSAAFCRLMSEEARRQTVYYAKVSSGVARQWDCEAAVDLLVVRSKRAGGLKRARRAELIGVNVEGDRATATVAFGGKSATTVPLVREDGEWRLGSAALGR